MRRLLLRAPKNCEILLELTRNNHGGFMYMGNYQRPSAKDDLEALEQSAYEEAYNRIEAQIVAENVADGADEATFKADGAQVHQRVMKEMSERKHCED